MSSQANELAASFKLLEIFSGISRRKLNLFNGMEELNDGSNITLNFESDCLYLRLEEQLSYIIFQSDGLARDTFVTQYRLQIEKIARSRQIPLHALDVEKALTSIVACLEFHRVMSLWGLLYPGSYRKIRTYRRLFLESQGENIRFELPTYIASVEAQLPLQGTKFDIYEKVIQQALQQVEYRTHDATLAVAKWLFSSMLEEFLRYLHKNPATFDPGKMKIEDKIPYLNKFLRDFSGAPAKLREGYQKSIFVGSKEEQEAQAKARTLLQASKEELLNIAGQTGEEMRRVLSEVRQALREAESKDEWLRQSINAKVLFHDVTKDDLAPDRRNLEYRAELEEKASRTGTARTLFELQTELELVKAVQEAEPDDRATVRRLRSLFNRVISKNRIKLEDSGLDIDVPAWIERKLSKTETPCFKHSVSGRGFQAFLLLDRSYSMIGPKTIQTERACRILAEALRYPFVKLTVWGFQSLDNGQVDIIRYAPGLPHYSIPSSKVDGGTPLHHAIRIASRELNHGNMSKHLFVLTDGLPNFANKEGRRINPERLKEQARQAIRQGRKEGINILGTLIGSKYSNEIIYDLTESEMSFVFGARSTWSRIEPDHVGEDLVRLVARNFIRYLGHV